MIYGRAEDCAYVIALFSGYEDGIDNGEEYFYTGAGGRDLSGNERTAKQSRDQRLEASSRALAFSCNAKLDNKNGAEATDWRAGVPIRKIRNYKLRSHSKYASIEENRYDCIYKVVKYWPVKCRSGFIV